MLGMGSGEPTRAAKLDATYFDHWYADMAASPVRDAIVARTLGLPPELHSTSQLTWQGIAEVTEALRMPQDGLLVDVAYRRAPARSGLLRGCPGAGQVEQRTAAAGRPVGVPGRDTGRDRPARSRRRRADVRGRGPVRRSPARRAARVPPSAGFRCPAGPELLGGGRTAGRAGAVTHSCGEPPAGPAGGRLRRRAGTREA